MLGGGVFEIQIRIRSQQSPKHIIYRKRKWMPHWSIHIVLLDITNEPLRKQGYQIDGPLVWQIIAFSSFG